MRIYDNLWIVLLSSYTFIQRETELSGAKI